MTLLDIITYPDKRLRRKAAPVETVDDEVRQIIADMAETMYAAPGMGLASVQVGIDKRIIIYDISGPEDNPKLEVLVNPEIVESEGAQLSESEGCLSVPDFRSDVNRFERVKVEALDRDGQPVEIDTDGLHAIVLQHEIDHLDGVLFIDKISALKREMYKRKVKKALKKNS
ncbi:MAG: Peptide deformylase (EC 3.5.1.88) [Olavius algarvensis Delta 4 endosymbiont]|nr:MAG: Peptide deformylase (EC 3.5.1.88) [Olavius algarvensis Delta 4 endosymbiont]